MNPNYVLHYAPDNASLVIRLAMEELGVSYDTILVDRSVRAQDSASYRGLNPAGLIPVLETPDGPIFETAAILLWLADRHGALAPSPEATERAAFLKWLFFASNTVHADLRQLFYADAYIGTASAHQAALRSGISARLRTHLSLIEAQSDCGWMFGRTPSVLDIYLACMLRWMALYPASWDRSWFDLGRYPRLSDMCRRLEQRPSVLTAQTAEGLGPYPFTAPDYATPPEGSAT